VHYIESGPDVYRGFSFVEEGGMLNIEQGILNDEVKKTLAQKNRVLCETPNLCASVLKTITILDKSCMAQI
jgi:hypothetical protein